MKVSITVMSVLSSPVATLGTLSVIALPALMMRSQVFLVNLMITTTPVSLPQIPLLMQFL